MSDYDSMDSLNDFNIFWLDREGVKDELFEYFDSDLAEELSHDEMFVYEILDTCADIMASAIENTQLQTECLAEAIRQVAERKNLDIN